MKDIAICIPAYNRVDCLIDLLSTIVKQINNSNRHRIQICVSDDCSPNDLEGPSKEYMKEYEVEYIYHRNSVNLGADKNFLKSSEIATARYCWLMGDDDGIPDGKIDVMLNYIDKFPDVNVFFANRYVCDRNLKPKMKEKWTSHNDDFCVDFCDRHSIKMYFDQLNSTTCLGYLSVLIVKKEAWDSISFEEYKPYIKTIYIQVAKYLLMLYNKDQLFRITDYLAFSRFGLDNFFSSLKQRVFMDYYGFLQLSHIFDADPVVKDSFLGIVRRHYNNVFLHAMAFTAKFEPEDIEVIRQVGYNNKQIHIFTHQNRFISLCGFGISVIKMIFTDFYWFRKTCFVTMQKLKK